MIIRFEFALLALLLFGTLSCSKEIAMSNSTLDERYRSLLSSQLTWNEQTWARLQELGVTEATELELDFSYVAPGESEARALGQVLAEETDYRILVAAGDSESWSVSGSTMPTTVSQEILDQWVKWMITAGLHQDCDFDGWGTQVP
jgi:regulator of ribonuclease activity B